MTTLRERIERGELNEEIKKYFIQNRGTIPLCCFQVKNEKGITYVRCGWSKDWLPLEKFREFCQKCQEEIAQKLKVKIEVSRRVRKLPRGEEPDVESIT